MTIVPLPIPDGQTPFDAIRQEDERGEFWTGRDLQSVLDYTSWDKFEIVILKARDALALIEGAESSAHHFSKWESDGGRWGNTKLEDYRLTRFGAYLTAMAGDDTKRAVAEGRIYFAVKARAQEIAEQAAPVPARVDYAALDINDPQMVMVLADAARRSAELVLVERERANQAEARADALEPAARNWEAVASNDGLTLRAFRKTYFRVTETAFMDHLYAKGYLINQRGKGGWSEKRQAYRDGSQHRHPGWRGDPYLYLHSSLDRSEIRRLSARVRPGDPEAAFKDQLAKEGLPLKQQPNRLAIESR